MRSPRPRRPVRCDQTGQEFISSAEAARVLGLSAPNISMHLNGVPGHKQVGGYTFTPIPRKPVSPDRPLNFPMSGPSRARAVLCNETKQVFRSVNDAARRLRISGPNIYKHLKNPETSTHVGGYTFTEVKLEF